MPSRPEIEPPQSIDAGLSWYVVRTATQRERRALEGLLEAGFAAYLPRTARWGRHAGVRHRVTRPLFVGYLFVGVDHATQSIYDAKAVDGVHTFVQLGTSEPRPVSVGPIQALLDAELDGAFDATRKGKDVVIAKGDKLRVTVGPFFGFIVEALSTPRKDRVKVLFQMLGRTSEASFDVSQLSAA